MLLPSKKHISKGRFWGEFESSIGDGNRLRLSEDLCEALKAPPVQELYRFPDPTEPGIILCPPLYHQFYINLALENLPADMEETEAYRKFIFSGKAISIGSGNRISLTLLCLRWAKLKEGSRVKIFGTGLWYFVTRDDLGMENNQT